MKRLMMTLAAGSLLLFGCDKGNKKPESQIEKVSYAIGNQIGNNLKSQEIKVDVDVFAAGVRDVLNNKEPKITQQDMQQAMMDMQKSRMEVREKEAEENGKKAKAWLEENGKKEGVKTTASGLQYKVLTEGNGKIPNEDDAVKVHYKGTLTDGSEFDSSYSRNEPAKFPLKGVIPGWTEALKLMKVGSKYELYIPPELAYGKVGRPKIPANSVLVFQVELLEILAKEEPKQAKGEKKSKKG